MSNTFYFYVCNGEYKNFKGLLDDIGRVVECKVVQAEGAYSDIHCKFSTEGGVLSVIVVNGQDVKSKIVAGECYDHDAEELSGLMVKYFEDLEKIACDIFSKHGFGGWGNNRVVVITHWGGSPVEDKEAAFSNAVAKIKDDRFRYWDVISSSSSRQSAFPEGYNPFDTREKARLPNAEVCAKLEHDLRAASKIEWKNIDVASKAELKEMYNRLMLKLNH